MWAECGCDAWHGGIYSFAGFRVASKGRCRYGNPVACIRLETLSSLARLQSQSQVVGVRQSD